MQYSVWGRPEIKSEATDRLGLKLKQRPDIDAGLGVPCTVVNAAKIE